jgi:hypothetical protein
MKMMNRLAICCAIALFAASTAQAVVTINLTNDAAGTVPVGGTFAVDVAVAYDGSPVGLTGVFTSVGWDPAELSFVEVAAGVTQPFAIFSGGTGFLGKVVDGGQSFPGDTAGTTRSIQYQAGPGQTGSAGANIVITTYVFEVVGEGDGTAEIETVFNNGDGVFVNIMDIDPGALVLNDTAVTVPEPASAMLALSALGTVVWVARRRSHRDA